MSKLLDNSRIYYGWIIVVSLFVASMFNSGAVFYAFTAIIEPISQELSWSYAQISLAISLRGVEVSLLAPIVGAIVDRFGARRLMFIGMFFSVAGLFLLSQTYSLATYYGSFILITLGASTTSMTAITALLAQWFKRRIGFATGIIFSGFACGGLVLPAVTALIEAYDWRVAMMALGGGTFIIVLPFLFLVRNRSESSSIKVREEFEIGATGDAVDSYASHDEADASVSQALHSRAFWHIAVVFFIYAFANVAVATHIMPYLSSVAMSRETASLIAMLLSLISIAGRLGMGWLADHWQYRKVILLGLTLMMLGMVCFAMVTVQNYWLGPFLVVYALGFGGVSVLGPYILRVYFGRRRLGSIFGLVASISMIGGVIGPPLAGWFFDKTASYQTIWLIDAGALLLAIFVIATCPKPLAEAYRRRKQRHTSQ
jgi:MFS family permease